MTPVLSKEIIEEWNLESLPEGKRFAIVDKIGRIMYQAILVKSLDILSDKEQDGLDELLDKNSTTPQQVLAFLRSKIPTFDQLIRDERRSLKEDLLIKV
jgi:hypothetical protein